MSVKLVQHDADTEAFVRAVLDGLAQGGSEADIGVVDTIVDFMGITEEDKQFFHDNAIKYVIHGNGSGEVFWKMITNWRAGRTIRLAKEVMEKAGSPWWWRFWVTWPLCAIICLIAWYW